MKCEDPDSNNTDANFILIVRMALLKLEMNIFKRFLHGGVPMSAVVSGRASTGKGIMTAPSPHTPWQPFLSLT